MAGVNNFTAGQVLSAAALNANFNNLPYAVAVGTATTLTGALAANAEATATVTFPASRFAVAPIVMAWTGSRRYIAVATTIAAGSATITVRNVSDATGTTDTIYYQAIQMTAGTAVG
jgi:ABC-type nitrate/sulfonate/bicarbonate transport system permease component